MNTDIRPRKESGCALIAAVFVLLLVPIVEVHPICKYVQRQAAININSLYDDPCGNMTVPFRSFTTKLIIPNEYSIPGVVDSLDYTDERNHSEKTTAGIYPI
ncbi:uncharacterized protein LOC119378347 [Rhipicephalus sanguineus]|uniref:uncharacterized protein LOC119378347 n=1 Tax=Rhipicephalus sanguineus TaxID=34632 RepID=UPI0018938D36|nr:uncharacterized protein LOC119378347 [Rhipicephalus sanguineus]